MWIIAKKEISDFFSGWIGYIIMTIFLTTTTLFTWILDNELLTYSFTTNDHHIEQGLKEIDNRIDIFHDPNNMQKYDFYIVNGFSKNELIDINFPNILFVQNHTNDHFRYIGNKNYLNGFFLLQENVISKGFTLVTKFKGNGPPVYVFKQLNS